MDNQHRKITGYRELGENEIKMVNLLKALEEEVANALEAIDPKDEDLHAGRWVTIAREHLETGFMYAIKAVARPANGLGRR